MKVLNVVVLLSFALALLPSFSLAQRPAFVRTRIDSVNPAYSPKHPYEWLVDVEAEIFDANLHLLSPSIASAYRWYENLCDGQGWQIIPNESAHRLDGYDGMNIPYSGPDCCENCPFQANEIRVEVDIDGQTFVSAAIRVPDNGTGELVATRGVTLDQTRGSGSSFGRIGRFDFDAFYYYPARHRFGFFLGRETVRATQEIVPAPLEKYFRWTDLPDVQNHAHIPIGSNLPPILTSQFKSTDSIITIKTDLVDLPGTTGGDIQFKDPWLVDTTDSRFYEHPYGYRNLGMNAPFKPESSPFYPTLESKYKGVFLNQGGPINNWSPPYYSVGAPNPNTIGGYESYFVKWDDSQPAQIAFQNANASQTGVVFKKSGATGTAKYKAHLASTLTSATGTNSQRKLVSYSFPSLAASQGEFNASVTETAQPSVYFVYRRDDLGAYSIRFAWKNMVTGTITRDQIGSVPTAADPHPVIGRAGFLDNPRRDSNSAVVKERDFSQTLLDISESR